LLPAILYLRYMHPSSFKLVVSKPCKEDWHSMQPVERGRHCDSCNKLVHDFASMNDDDITDFFIRNGNQPVCGRFQAEQIQRTRIYLPTYIFRKPIPAWKKSLLVLLLCFGSDLFLADVYIGHSPGLHAQEVTINTIVKKPGVKKPFKKKAKLKIQPTAETLIFDRIEHYFLGYTIITPEYPVIPSLVINIPPTVDTQGTEADPTVSLSHSDQKEQTPSPGKNNNTQKMEFILPAPLYARRRKRK
jgi:hypothetical protein